MLRCISSAISASVRPPQDLNLEPFGLTPDSYWKHCVAVLSFAEELASRGLANFGSEFSTAALLHDFGKLILARHISPAQAEAMQRIDPAIPGTRRELEVLSVHHGEVTAVVAQTWKLSDALVQAVQHHHTVDLCDTPLCHGLNIANQLAWQLEEREFDLAREADSLQLSRSALKLSDSTLQSIYADGVTRLEASLEVY